MNFRFAIASDLHIATPPTIWNHPSRFHLVEISISALEKVFNHLEQLQIDFLLIPGDLTQDGEVENHQWLEKRLESLPYPVYVVPGNHDVPNLNPIDGKIGFQDFPYYYRKYGYNNPKQIYYSHEIFPGLQLIGLNSNQFNSEGKQLGCLDEQQLIWLEQTLTEVQDKFIILMVHHNVIEHLPGQSSHQLGKRYMLDNAPKLLNILKQFGVKLIFTGHLHVQDVASHDDIYEITTGSLVTYPHPYRILNLQTKANGCYELNIESYKINSVPGWEDLSGRSREWIGQRSKMFMMKLLTESPLNLSATEAEKYLPSLRYFWADIASGDNIFNFPDFPQPVREYFEQFGAIDSNRNPNQIDNKVTLLI